MKETIIRGVKNGINTTLMLAKVIIPVYFFITFLKHTPVLDMMARFLDPVMNLFYLPGEAALVLVIGNALTLYAAIGAIKALDLSSFQITTLALMLSFSHSLFMESAVIKQLKVNTFKMVLLRISLMIIAGLIMGMIGGAYNW